MRVDGPNKGKRIAIIGSGHAPIGSVAEALHNINEREKMNIDVPIEIFPYLPSPAIGIGSISVRVPRPNKYQPHQGKKEMERRAKMLSKEVAE